MEGKAPLERFSRCYFLPKSHRDDPTGRIIIAVGRFRLQFSFCLLVAITAGAQPLRAPQPTAPSSSPWTIQTSYTTASLRGIHAVNAEIAWASGTGGTILRTLDGGAHWQLCTTPPNAAKLDFRAIWAFDARTAWAMSSGPGNLSRLYRTTDGCAHWKLLATNGNPKGFWDAITFWSPEQGAILGDPVDGKFVVLLTEDGGRHWRRDHSADLNIANRQLSAFAASNSSLLQVSGASGNPQSFATGGPGGPVVFLSWTDCTVTLALGNPRACLASRFSHYQQVRVPMAGGTPSSGIFAWASHPLDVASKSLYAPIIDIDVAVGGDYTKPNDPSGTAAWSTDGGVHWTAARKPPHGYRSTVAWDPANHAWITAGTNGSDISYDGGKAWHSLGNGNWNAISLPFIVGPNGRIGHLNPAALPK